MKDRDIEKIYTKEEFVSKLRRLADCIEKMRTSEYPLLERQFMYLMLHNLASNTKEVKEQMN